MNNFLTTRQIEKLKENNWDVKPEGFHKNLPTIRFGGWSDFVVRESEIISIV
jgi:hypothetical protein